MNYAIVLSVLAIFVIVVACSKDGEWDKFKKNNVKQPKDDELPKDVNES